MLSEMETESDLVSFITVGMGLNVNNSPGAHLPQAESLSQIVGRPLSRVSLLSAFLDEFEAQIERLQTDCLVSDWKALCITLGRQVTIDTIRDTKKGLAEDVQPDGSLLLRLADGALTPVVFGDCFIN